jgi:hypothetical protein
LNLALLNSLKILYLFIGSTAGKENEAENCSFSGSAQFNLSYLLLVFMKLKNKKKFKKTRKENVNGKLGLR